MLGVSAQGQAETKYITPYSTWYMQKREKQGKWQLVQRDPYPVSLNGHMTNIFGQNETEIANQFETRMLIYASIAGHDEQTYQDMDQIYIGRTGRIQNPTTHEIIHTASVTNKQEGCAVCKARDHTATWRWSHEHGNGAIMRCDKKKRKEKSRYIRLQAEDTTYLTGTQLENEEEKHTEEKAQPQENKRGAHVWRWNKEEQKEDEGTHTQGEIRADHLKILSWNMGRQSNIKNLLAYATKNKIDVICLQEAQRLGPDKKCIAGKYDYDMFWHGKVAMLIKQNGHALLQVAAMS